MIWIQFIWKVISRSESEREGTVRIEEKPNKSYTELTTTGVDCGTQALLEITKNLPPNDPKERQWD